MSSGFIQFSLKFSIVTLQPPQAAAPSQISLKKAASAPTTAALLIAADSAFSLIFVC